MSCYDVFLSENKGIIEDYFLSCLRMIGLGWCVNWLPGGPSVSKDFMTVEGL